MQQRAAGSIWRLLKAPLIVHLLGAAKVNELQVALLVQQNVLRFQISVNDLYSRQSIELVMSGAIMGCSMYGAFWQH